MTIKFKFPSPKYVVNLLELLNLLSLSRKLQLLFAVILSNISSLLELLTLASIIPITSFLLEPDSSWFDFKSLAQISWLDLSNDKSRALILLVSVIFAFAVSTTTRILNLYFGLRLSANIGIDLSRLILKKIVFMRYTNFIQINSSTLISLVNDDVNGILSACNALLQFMSSFSFALFAIVALFAYDAQLGLPLITSFALLYGIYIFTGYRFFVASSHKVATYRVNALKSLQNIFGSFREMIVYNLQLPYVSAFEKYNSPAKILTANNSFLTYTPKIIVESLAIVALLSLAIYQHFSGISATTIITSIGVLALASQKILPAFQQISHTISVLSLKTADISRVLDFLTASSQCFDEINVSNLISGKPRLNNSEIINFSNVAYSYPKSKERVIDLVNLSVEVGKFYGIVGESGSGKSTLIDLILGLLKPQSGCISTIQIDKESSPTSKSAYSSSSKSLSFGIVPQQVFLAEATILENIAYGLDYDSIDFERVRKVASDACIDKFILSLPKGYQTNVGERGVLLSGGQVQRIGIARSLYYSSDVLIFDEATSALDQSTEADLITNIHSSNSQLAVIMIAHRLSTLSRCDKIIHVSNGKLIEYPSLEDYQKSLG